MRFVILTQPGADDLDTARYHEELVRAGVLLAGDQAAGFWLLEVDSPRGGRRVGPPVAARRRGDPGGGRVPMSFTRVVV